MEGLLQHQNSTASFQRNYKSCMWDWLRGFDLHRRLSVKKLLEESSHGNGSHAGRPKGYRPYAPLSVSENKDLGDDRNRMIVEKVNQTKRSPGKALVRSLLFKKLFRKHRQGQKPLKPRLTRTNSIHHLECDDYVLPDEMTCDGDRSIDYGSQKTDSSKGNALPLLTRRFRSSGTMKGIELVAQTEVEHLAADQEKLVKELEQAHHDVFKSSDLINRMELLNAQSASFLEMIRDPDLMLEKDFRRSSLRSRRTRSSGELPDYYLLNSLESKNQGNHETSLDHSKNVKKKLKDPVNEKHLHISLDGYLHRIPYGQSVEKLHRSSSARSHQESTSEDAIVPPKAYPYQRFRRSHSLTDSSYIYSHGFESSTLQDRIDANPGFKSFSCKDVQSEPSNGALLSKPTPSPWLNNNEAAGIHVPAELKSGDTLTLSKKLIEPDTIPEQALHANADATIDEEIELQLILNELTREENIACITSPKGESVEQQGSQIELQQSGLHEDSDSSQILHGHVVVENGLVVSSAIEPSPASAVDSDYECLPRPAKCEFSAGSENESRTIHVEVPDLLAKEPNSLRLDADKLCVHVDQKDEVDFNYVRFALMKSPLNGFDLVGPTLLPGELCDSPDDFEVSSHDSSTDLSSDQQALSDLINEILLELSERYSIASWFSRFDSRTRVMPAECNVLEEVWRRASSHLSSQGQPPHMYEYVVAQDLARDEGWLNLKQDALSLGTELESCVLDDLVDELVIEHFEDIWDHLHFVSS